MARRTSPPAYKPPSPRQMMDSRCEEIARDVMAAHPKVVKMRKHVERRLKTAMRGATRGLMSAR